MTLNEIDNLTVQDVEDRLRARVFNKFEQSEIEEEYISFEDFVFEQTDLEAELVLYKAELVEIETERLRLEDLNNRIDALYDMPYAHATLRSDIPNAALWVKQNILNNSNHAEAEFFLGELEAKDLELKAEVDDINAAKELIKQKREALKNKPDNQITLPELIEVVKSLL